ncbi:MAG TPA: hypothetical protein VI357_27510 [Mycobacteriales bacterium]
MSPVEELLTRTLRDPARTLPVPADPVPAIRHRARRQRRNTALGLAAMVLVVAATLLAPAAAGRFTRPAPVATHPAPRGSGLLEWPASGPLAGDTALVRDAAERWRDSTGTVRLVWAGRVGTDRVVLLQATGSDGTPALAQVADRAGTLTLLTTEPIRDPGVSALRLVDPAGPAARTLLLARPGAVTVRVLLGSGLSAPVPAGGVVDLPGELAGQPVAVLDRDGRVVGDGDLPRPGGLAVVRGDVRLAAAGWDGNVEAPEARDYAAGRVLGSLLGPGPGRSYPVEVAGIEGVGTLDLRSGRQAEPRFYELHRAGRTYLGWVVWVDGTPHCAHLDDVTDSGVQPDALVLRCALPQERAGLVEVHLHNGIRLSGLRLDAARPGETTVARTFPLPLDNGYVSALDALPTGPGRLRLEDVSGQARSPITLPPYEP